VHLHGHENFDINNDELWWGGDFVQFETLPFGQGHCTCYIYIIQIG